MNHDPLIDLLRREDSELQRGVAPPAGLAGKARGRLARRQRRRTFGMLASTSLAAVAFTLWWSTREVAIAPAHPDDSPHRIAVPVWKARETATAPVQSSIAGSEATSNPFSAEEAWAECERLREEAEFYQALGRRLIAERQRDEAIAEAKAIRAQIDPVDPIPIEQERTAFGMMLRADRYLQAADRQRAEETYERVLQLFPTTGAADLARQRLESPEMM